MLGAESEYKAHLIHVLEEPPIGPDQLPPNVPPPSEEFFGGLQNRFVVVGANPFALEEGGLVELHVMVTTDSGTYEAEYAIHTALRWKVTTGISNVPINVPVLLHGKEQAAYDWALTAPGGSAAALMDATGQNPEFTPDVVGMYTVTVMDEATMEAETLNIYAGTWRGIIIGEDAAGNPTVDGAAPPATATPWRTGPRPATPRSSRTPSIPTPTTARAVSPATPSASTPTPTTAASTRRRTTRRSSTRV